MAQADETLLIEQHRSIESGISGLVDGSGSRQEFIEAVRLLREHDRKEETAIYAVAQRYATDASRPSLASLFVSDAIPSGWRCQHAPTN